MFKKILLSIVSIIIIASGIITKAVLLGEEFGSN